MKPLQNGLWQIGLNLLRLLRALAWTLPDIGTTFWASVSISLLSDLQCGLVIHFGWECPRYGDL